MQRLLLLVVCVTAGCHTFDPKHPVVGRPDHLAGAPPAFYIWVDDGVWHVRLWPGAGKSAHRFQGSVTGVRGGVIELAPTRPGLGEAMALGAGAVQFDVESAAREPLDGFDVKVAGGCARFDLYLDGHYHAERVHLGPRGLHPAHLPFERCP